MATSKEKDDMISALKDKIRELETKVPTESESANPTETAFTVVKKGEEFFLVEFGYDPDTKIAVFKKEDNLGKQFPVVFHKAKQFLGEKILPYQRYLLKK